MSLINELEAKLKGGKFRMMNEKLCTRKTLSHEEMAKYREYYEEQAKKWPVDPKTKIIEEIKELPPSVKIADLGCGSAEISNHFKNVTSFDKYPQNEEIIKCDIQEIKAENEEFDVAVCCLSLMMRYISKVLKEVNRILKKDGIFFVAEVRSRIPSVNGFIKNVEKFGFKLKDVDVSNSHFVIVSFEKTLNYIPPRRLPEVKLDACLYKKR